MKKIVVSLVMILSFGCVSNTAYGIVNDPIGTTEKKILTELEKSSNEATTFENVEIDLKENELVIQATTQIDEETREIEIVQKLEEDLVNSNGMKVAEKDEDGTSNYSLYFGTLEQKEKLDTAIEEEKILLEEIEQGKYSEEELKEIELPTKKIMEDESTHITTEEQFVNTPIVVTDENSHEQREILPEDGVASGFVIGPGIRIAIPVAQQLIKMFFAAVVGGLLGLALTIFARNANYRQFYEHYRAVRTGRVGIVVYSGMNLNTAVNYMKLRGDLWSTTPSGAYQVARLAGGLRGGKFQAPVADRAHGPGNFPHYHTWNRSGGHSFYGVASNK